MSMELIDARIKITEETDVFVDYESLRTGKDRSEVMRFLLHEIALKRINEATLLCKTMQSKGLTGKPGA